jgi:hypothetical protein
MYGFREVPIHDPKPGERKGIRRGGYHSCTHFERNSTALHESLIQSSQRALNSEPHTLQGESQYELDEFFFSIGIGIDVKHTNWNWNLHGKHELELELIRKTGIGIGIDPKNRNLN